MVPLQFFDGFSDPVRGQGLARPFDGGEQAKQASRLGEPWQPLRVERQPQAGPCVEVAVQVDAFEVGRRDSPTGHFPIEGYKIDTRCI